ncbi:MAG: hypothetical protein KDK78_09355, partial [Chlamydiia bacterium]|nr:hypothetical protein [Chlamydiia bacterium]
MGITEDEEGLKYRVFELKGKYRIASWLADDAQGALFPAIEPTAAELAGVFAGYEVYLRELGYEWDDGKLKLPEREALLNNWEWLRSLNPSLPNISIYSCPNGSASNAQFLKEHVTHDALLSEG